MALCKLCAKDAIELPTDLATLEVTCRCCQRLQRVSDYVSDSDRLRGVGASIMAAKAERDQKLADGVACSACGGTTALPANPSVRSFSCAYCGTNLLVADYVDARVLAGSELKAGMDAIYAEHKRKHRLQNIIGMSAFGVFLVVLIILTLLFGE